MACCWRLRAMGKFIFGRMLRDFDLFFPNAVSMTMGWRCGSLVFYRCFGGFLRFTRNIRRFWRLAMPWWSPGWIPRNCTQIRARDGAAGRSYFSDVSMDSCVSNETFVVFGALRCRDGLQGGFLETVRKFDHVVALWVARVFPMFSSTRAFHSERSPFLTPCDAVVVSRADSPKLCVNSSMWWRCGSLVFSGCFCGLLRFARSVRRF